MACATIEEVGSTGVGALTITFLILGVSAAVFAYKAHSSQEQKRFYVCAIFFCFWSAMADFAMLSGQGWTVTDGCRQFFYARYVDWIVTAPVIAIWLGLVAGADFTDMAYAVVGQVVWVAATYMGSISVASEVKWVWFLISLFGLAAAVFNFSRAYDSASKSKSEELTKLYSKMAWTTIAVFACYPLVWLFSEGFGNFSVSFEVTMYCILDVIGKSVVGFMLLGAHDLLGDASPVSQREFV